MKICKARYLNTNVCHSFKCYLNAQILLIGLNTFITNAVYVKGMTLGYHRG